jgi:hypothetical protein
MCRSAYAVISVFMLTMMPAATVLAESHPVPATTSGGTATTVTAVPSTGIGMLTEQTPSALVLGLLALSALLAVMAMTT